MTWFVLSILSAFFQVLRNMTMKRLGHELDEYINVWGGSPSFSPSPCSSPSPAASPRSAPGSGRPAPSSR